jgi:hypothetical protein
VLNRNTVLNTCSFGDDQVIVVRIADGRQRAVFKLRIEVARGHP